jgi:type I restriction enzyme, S subunit
MTSDTIEYPRAFAVWFKDLGRWDASSFHRITWHWPERVMAPIGSALRLRKERVDKTAFKFSDLQPLTIHFDGSVDKRVVDANREYSMDLWFARPGDIVVAKIDLKNGAVGIVPPDWSNVVVTGHFAVYEPDRSRLLPEYLHRIIQTGFFKAHLWRNKVGAEGRKEVKLDFFEEGRIPLPSLAVQNAIVARWRKAQDEIAAARERVTDLETQIQRRFLSDLGLRLPGQQQKLKAFALCWKELERWGVAFGQQASTSFNAEAGKYPVVHLRDVIFDLENGWSPQCLNRAAEEGEWGVLKLGAVSFGYFNDKENKALPSGLTPVPALEVNQGQVLISRANITRLVGACALVTQTRSRLMLCDKIFRVVFLEQSPIDAAYLAEVMKIPQVRRQIEAAATGTSATMQNITKPSLLALRLPLPPVSTQREIVLRASLARAEIAREQEAADKLAMEISADVEALILGTKNPNEQ